MVKKFYKAPVLLFNLKYLVTLVIPTYIDIERNKTRGQYNDTMKYIYKKESDKGHDM